MAHYHLARDGLRTLDDIVKRKYPVMVCLRAPPRGPTASEATVRRAYTSSARTSSPLVFARFQHVTTRQQFVPIFLASRLATGLLEFKEREMGVAFILCSER
jgi:hypothetical protein